jgi:hypothetical protein
MSIMARSIPKQLSVCKNIFHVDTRTASGYKDKAVEDLLSREAIMQRGGESPPSKFPRVHLGLGEGQAAFWAPA